MNKIVIASRRRSNLEGYPSRLLRLLRSLAITGGFTLLELLVAMTILSTVIAGVYAAFHAGVMAARRAAQEDSSVQNILGRLHLMSSEIRNAVYWNNVVIAGTQTELYFFVPMMLKDPKDIFPLYRVRYWYEKSAEKTGVLYRSVAPWIELQKPDQSADEIARLEKTQAWLGPLENFKLDYAMAKPFSPLGASDSAPSVAGNPTLTWASAVEPSTQIPFGVRMQWTMPSGQAKARNYSTVFWPALGIYQQRKSLTNVAPVSTITVPEQRP